jgi:hypothetical protein
MVTLWKIQGWPIQARRWLEWGCSVRRRNRVSSRGEEIKNIFVSAPGASLGGLLVIRDLPLVTLSFHVR